MLVIEKKKRNATAAVAKDDLGIIIMTLLLFTGYIRFINLNYSILFNIRTN
jgi:hypothetical protein